MILLGGGERGERGGQEEDDEFLPVQRGTAYEINLNAPRNFLLRGENYSTEWPTSLRIRGGKKNTLGGRMRGGDSSACWKVFCLERGLQNMPQGSRSGHLQEEGEGGKGCKQSR